jgi:hypothetical protein
LTANICSAINKCTASNWCENDSCPVADTCNPGVDSCQTHDGPG